MKYIIFQDQVGGCWPVIFPDHITHAQITVEGMKPVTAGFFDPRTGEAYGKSVSLKLHSGTADELWLRLALENNGAELYLLNTGGSDAAKAFYHAHQKKAK